MKLVFFSNFLNHHQLPLCEAFLLHREAINFTFVATESVPDERKKMNYEDLNSKYDFVLCTYNSEKAYQKALVLAKEADVVIFGSAPLEFLAERMKYNKLTFRFCERSLKKGTWRRFIPFTYKKIYEQYIKYRNSNLYILAASAFTSYDLSLCGFPATKCFKWGYFPECKQYEDFDQLLEEKNSKKDDVVNLLWVARFISLKHPEIPLLLVKKLLSLGYKVRLNMVGNGILFPKIENMIKKLHLEREVKLHGALPIENVRLLMEQSDILLFTSNKYEGWGAVVNEAMNSGCVVLASKVIGSVPYLIKDGVTGYSYNPKRFDELLNVAIKLIENSSLRKEIALNAYNSLINEWNASVASNRFLKLVDSIQKGQSVTYQGGPCSLANILICR